MSEYVCRKAREQQETKILVLQGCVLMQHCIQLWRLARSPSRLPLNTHRGRYMHGS
jgi:hypothetical protein